MKIIRRSNILKENNKLFIQVSISDNEKESVEDKIIYGKNIEEILNKYEELKIKVKGE